LSGGALVPIGKPWDVRRGLRLLLPAPLRALDDELEARLRSLPTPVNEYGYDPFGLEPSYARGWLLPSAVLYRYWFRVKTKGIEQVPEGRVLLIGNHAGNTFAFDGAMLAVAMLLEANPPRAVRGMAEYYLPTIPFFNVFMHRLGSVVGTPENCIQLLEEGEAIMVFPEGRRGFVKPYTRRYQLQRFGLGFMRLALETDTPIVPIGFVGSEEQSPGLANAEWLGKWIGAPAFPITPTFPWFGLFGFVPLPVRFHIHFGAPLRFEGDPSAEDAEVKKKVKVVKDAIAALMKEALAERRGWFA
jgi:1-acyl-sn-glycerol-3-phosphate acyltransferase